MTWIIEDAPVAPQPQGRWVIEDAPPRSTTESLGRQVGLTARAGITGITTIPAMLANVPAGLYNAGMDAYDSLRSPTLSELISGKQKGYRFPDQNAALSQNLTVLGLPQPENATERVVQDVAGAMSGAGGMMKVGDLMSRSAAPAAMKIGDLLKSAPTLQTASAVTGPGAAGIVRESGGDESAQLLAGIGGSFAPQAATAAGSAAVRGIARFGETGRLAMADRIKAFTDAGTMPSVGQATGGRIAQSKESFLSRTPGSASVMVKAGEKQAAEMGAKVEEIADELSPKASAAKAGAQIEKGIDKFVDRFKAEQGFLYDKLDQYVPGDARVPVQGVLARLDKLTAPISGAETISRGALGNTALNAIRADLVKDAQDGTLPYAALKGLRTRIGEKIADSGLTADVSRAQWKQLYGALSDDMAAAAKAAGPEAERAYARANAYTAAGHQRIDTFLDRVAGKDTVEKIFTAATNPSELKEGASTINAVMRSLESAERKVVQAAFIRRMGSATAGNQNDLGETFSAQTFLTNWNKASPEAKMTLFADGKGDLRENLDQIAKAANIVREGSKVFANPSGTAQTLANIGTGTALGGSIATGNIGAAAMIVGAMTTANLTARVMTNQNFVRWLAQTTKVSPSALPAQINTLAQIAAKEQDLEARAEMENYMNNLTKK